jgi:adenosylmethionine-8-amino-7-oxononanoate aminotransferase
VIVRGEGAFLFDAAGTRLLDGGCTLGACAIGNGRRELADAIAAQVAMLSFVSLDEGLSNMPAIRLAEWLHGKVPVDDSTIWFVNSGSEANDLAIKLVRAHWRAAGASQRVKIIARAGSYHGATYGALSATGMPMSREPYAPVLPGIVRASQPSPGRCGYCSAASGCTLECADDLERIVRQEGVESVAGFIAEPVAMTEAIKVPHPGYWPRIREICDRHDILLVVDEVITGFGRTGTWFGLEHWGVQADIVTLAKGVTSAYFPLGAAAVSRRVMRQLAQNPPAHINTYSGHPVACAAALKNLEILEREALVENAARLEPVVLEELERTMASCSGVINVSGIGLLSSIEFAPDDTIAEADGLETFRRACYERGLIVRGYPGVVYFYPPLVVTDDDVRFAFEVIREALAVSSLATARGSEDRTEARKTGLPRLSGHGRTTEEAVEFDGVA